jgi:hypothetical protein
MKRGGPLKRTAFKRKKPETLAPSPEPEEHQAKPELRPRKGLRSRGPRMTPIRRSAKDEDCTILIPGICNGDTSTTVLCHSNLLADGKGMGLKAPDTEACYGCSACHDVLDGRRPLPSWLTRAQLEQAFNRARSTTQKKLKEKGLMP